MITSLAHSGLCVPDLDAAVAWYTRVLGLELRMPPVRMAGPEIEADMGDLIPSPVVLRGAILGLPGGGDRVIELLEYPDHPGTPRPPHPKAPAWGLTDHGFSHLGLVCDDLQRTRSDLEAAGAEFLSGPIAEVAGLRTSWLRDPFGTVLILMEKRRDPERAYYAQTGGAEA